VDAELPVAALFADVAEVGPFFAVATGATPPCDEGWLPVKALWSDQSPPPRCADHRRRGARRSPAGGEPTAAGATGPLPARIAAVRAALGADERVAASTAFQGLTAQLVAPLFGMTVVGGALPARDPGTVAASLHWRPGPDGPWLWWAGPAGAPAERGDLGRLLAGLLGPLVAAVRAHVAISPRVLWSDAASAVASARRLVVEARPPLADRAAAVAHRLLTTPPLAPVAALRAPEPPDTLWTFRRRSCCLYYRVPGGGICGDCVLVDRRPRGG
jgi:hypothetical protein